MFPGALYPTLLDKVFVAAQIATAIFLDRFRRFDLRFGDALIHQFGIQVTRERLQGGSPPAAVNDPLTSL